MVNQYKLDELYQQGVFGLGCPHFLKLDIESHELNAFIGAVHLLQECKPIILFEADCKHNLRSIMALLDQIGYTMGWIAAHAVDLGKPFRGVEPRDLSEIFLSPYGLGLLDGGHNIIAYPKADMELYKHIPGIDKVVPIDFAGGKYYIEEYEIWICLFEGHCHMKSHSYNFYGLPEDFICCGTEISEYLRNYWMQIS